MTILNGLFAPRASLESASTPLTSTALLEWLGGRRVDSGVMVSERTAMAMAAVYRCVGVISNVCAAMPLHTYTQGTKDKVPTPLLGDPHPELTPLELWRLTFVHRTLWGNAYVQKVRNGAGQVRQLWPITPDRVMVERIRPSDGNPGGKMFTVTDDWGTVRDLTSRDILHMPGIGYDGTRGISVIGMAAQAIGVGLAAEKASARFFGRGALISGILKTDSRLDEKQAASLKARWQALIGGMDNAGDIGVLDSGASFQPVQMPSKDAQFLESRRFQVSEIARFFGVPLFLLSETEKSTSWGTGLEQQILGFVVFDLNPTWLTPTEQRVTKELVPSSRYAKYSVQGLLRGDSKARAEFYRAMREIGALSANDIRDLEDLPPIEGGDTYLQPLNFAPLGSDPTTTDEGDDA